MDNRAKVINMSFGKAYSPQQQWVEDTIRYAAEKDVLIIHVADNDAANADSLIFYPTATLSDGHYAPM